MALYKLNINGKVQSVEADSDMPLLWVLRDLIGLTGSKYGCGVGSCGACTILKDGKEARSCQTPVSEVGNAKIVTIEGLSADGSHPLQKAWIEHDVPQCGYCQVGQIMGAAALLKEHPKPTEAQIDEAMEGHICRCGTYQRIKEAIQSASKVGAR
jgi:aerobic-type carbon monoxide dehydrogenase small subunit (CoxS/CutS family)